MNQLDHIVYGAHDLAAAMEDLDARFGVRAQEGGRHPGLGTHNALLSLGERAYLELIAPDPSQPPPPRRPFRLDSLGEPGLVAWAVACDDIDAVIARARERGYDPGDRVELERAVPGGPVLRWSVAIRELGAGPMPFLISWGDTAHPARSAPSGLRLLDFRIEHPDPAAFAAQLAAIDVDAPVIEAQRTALVASIEGPTGTIELR
jgi:hypothetical protein